MSNKTDAQWHGAQPSALDARDDLLEITYLWPALMYRLSGTGGGDRSGVRTTPRSRMPIDAHLSDVIGELTEWTVFLARALMDEVMVETPVPGPVKGSWSEPWRPEDRSTPELLREIARERVGHFTHHPDEMLRIAFVDDARAMRRKAEKAAYPNGKKVVPLHIPCGEHDTDDEGRRVPCKGKYTSTLDEVSCVHCGEVESYHRGNKMGHQWARITWVADMICNLDRAHRISTPAWQAAKGKGSLDPEGVRRLITKLTG